MREELAMFVNDNYPPIKQELFNRAFEIFDDYEIEDYDTPFMDMMHVFDNSDYATFISEFESKISNTLLTIIEEHGLRLVDDVSIGDVVEIAKALLDIQSYEDKESIIRTLETEYEDDVEKLAELFSLVSSFDVQRLSTIVDDFNNGIFSTLEKYVNTEDTDVSEAVVVTDIDKAIVSNLRNYRTFVEDDQLIIFKVIEMGFSVGLEFSLYGRYLKRFIQEFDDIEKMAKEYFGVLIASKESHNNPLGYYRRVSSEYIDDLNIISKVDNALAKIYNDFDKFKTQLVESQTNKKEYYYQGLNSSSVPAGKYPGKATGYTAEFEYDGRVYEIQNKGIGVKGTNIPVTVIKYPSGYYTVDFTQHA